MLRRTLLAHAGLALLIASRPAGAQRPAISRIGYLWSGPRGSDPTEAQGLRQGLRELGWVEGQTIAIDARYASGNLDRLPSLIAELLALNVALLVTAGTPVTAAAMRHAPRTPIVSVTNDPLGSGFVQSLARPGGNLTGLSFAQDEGLCGKWLELVRETLRGASRIDVLWNPANRSNDAVMKEMHGLAPRFGLQIAAHPVQRPADIDAAFVSMRKTQAGGVIVVTDPFLTAQRAQIVGLATASRIPVFAGLAYVAEAGGLISYGPSLFDLFRRAGRYVDKILKGAKPADLPVEQPTAYELVINLATARSLGVTVPPAIRARADRVLE